MMLELFAVLHLGGHDRALASLRSSHKCVARGFGATAVRYVLVWVPWSIMLHGLDQV